MKERVSDERLAELAELEERDLRIAQANSQLRKSYRADDTASALGELQQSRAAMAWLMQLSALWMDPDGSWSLLDTAGTVSVPQGIEAIIAETWRSVHKVPPPSAG